MKFLVDAQLPVRLARFLQASGHDTIHTRNLPSGNATADSEINFISLAEQRVVITKDTDFVETFLLQRQPYKLLLISTGNIKNQDLELLFSRNLTSLIDSLEQSYFVELSWDEIIIHQ